MIRTRTLLPCALAAALLALAGCGRAPATGFFPLEAGHRWTYDVKTEHENNTVNHETLTLLTLGSDSIEGGSAWRRRSESGVDYWLRADASGIYRVASKSDLDADPRPDPAPRYVLKMPLVVGTTWAAPTTAYLLQRRQEFPREIRHSHAPVSMVYTIEALGEQLDTQAGRFERCLRVRGEARMRVFADPVQGWRDMPLSTIEWYCDGVGLVRLERREPARSTFLAGGVITLELTAWH